MPLYTSVTPAGTAEINGQQPLFFSGFSYLGLHAHPDFLAALKAGIDQFGAVFISSRIANVQLRLYEELENALALLLEQPAAATFSSGYLASQAATRYVNSLGQKLYAPSAHPSLQTGHYVPGTLSWQEWTTQTIEKVNTHPDHTFVIMADAVNPLTSTINDFSWLSGLQRQVTVLIDDSHGIGILGAKGQGIISLLPQHNHLHYLISASLAKAYSTQGGVIAGPTADIAAIKKQPFFTAATPMMPANAWAWMQSTTLHHQQRALLQTRIEQLKTLCTGLASVYNPFSLPVFLLENSAGLEQWLLERGIVISSFGYPHPDSPPINRVIVTPLHSTENITQLHEELRSILL